MDQARKWIAWCAAVALGLATGCGLAAPRPPAEKIAALTDAAKAVSVGVESTYPHVEQLQRRAAMARLAVNDRPTLDNYTIESPIGPRLRAREAKLAVIVSYLELLDAFASTDYGADVDKASIKLHGSVTTLAGEDQRATQAGGVLATITDVIGREIVERKRLAALKEAMTTAQGALETMVALLREDNDLIAMRASHLGKDIADNLVEVRKDRRFPMTSRAGLDQRVVESLAESEGVQDDLAAVNDALGKIPPAHREILDTLEAKPSSMAQLHQLVGEAQRIRKFYRGLKADDGS